MHESNTLLGKQYVILPIQMSVHTDRQIDRHTKVKTVYPPVSLRSLGGYKILRLLTIIEWITTASNNLESAVVGEVGLKLIPDALAVITTVTQLDDHSHRRRERIVCVIGAKPTHTNVSTQLLRRHSFTITQVTKGGAEIAITGKCMYGKVKYRVAKCVQVENTSTKNSSTATQGWKTQVQKIKVRVCRVGKCKYG